MDLALIAQIEQIIQWAATGLLKLKEADGTDAQWAPVFKQALTENRPMNDDEWASITTLVDTAVANALKA
jgi:hypothetical protein